VSCNDAKEIPRNVDFLQRQLLKCLSGEDKKEMVAFSDRKIYEVLRQLLGYQSPQLVFRP
jgi:hypothetical protein